MNRIIILISVIFSFSVTVFAADFSAVSLSNHTLYYNIVNGKVEVTHPGNGIGVSPWWQGYRQPIGAVIIPDSVVHNGLTYIVESISSCAFRDCIYITSITMGNNIKSIGASAFSGCSSLTSIKLSDSIKIIAGDVFHWCKSLSSISIPSSVSIIDNSAFNSCTSLQTIYIPDSVTRIGNSAFFNCSSLRDVIFGLSVCLVERFAFYGCPLDTLILLCRSVPKIEVPIFGNDAKIFVSCYMYENYIVDSGWSTYFNQIKVLNDVSYNVSVYSADTTRGIASIIPVGNRIIRCDSTIVLNAQSFFGYHFDCWSNGRSANPDTLSLIGDSSITAYFKNNQHLFTLTCSDSNIGILSGSGVFGYGDTVYFSASTKPNSHYHVQTVKSTSYKTADGRSYYKLWRNENIVDTMFFIMPNEDITVNVEFELDKHLVKLNVNDENAGVVSVNAGIGRESYTYQYAYGTTVILIAAPHESYHFKQWSNGVKLNPYALTVTHDTVLTAFFMSDTADGISERRLDDIVIYVDGRQIYVKSTVGKDVRVFDVNGRLIKSVPNNKHTIMVEVPITGFYFVKIDHYSPYKVLIIK